MIPIVQTKDGLVMVGISRDSLIVGVPYKVSATVRSEGPETVLIDSISCTEVKPDGARGPELIKPARYRNRRNWWERS